MGKSVVETINDIGKRRVFDRMQNHHFWLVDVSPTLFPPFFVLGAPLYGFNSMTMPEITLELQDVPQLNSFWAQHVYSGGSVGSITLTRGVQFFDSSFYDWVIGKAVKGLDVPYRNLLMIHYMGADIRMLTGLGNAGLGLEGTFETLNVPGRAWLLFHCLPTRYKAGGDFDATNADVSIMEIDVQPLAIQEIVLGV